MQLIIEGCDGTGKTTIAKILAEKHNCDILHMTRWGPKTLTSYLNRYDQTGLVSDRSFISEVIYSSVFRRNSELNENDCEMLLKYVRMQGFNIVILNLDTSEIFKRLNFRNDEDCEIMNNICRLSQAYVDFAEKYDITLIDVTNLNTDEIVKIIEEEILNV